MLVDVPCSGLGALRRRPESRWRKQPSDLDQLVPLQRRLLANALVAVRPGGIVGYVTCSPLPEETREVVDSVLARTDQPSMSHFWTLGRCFLAFLTSVMAQTSSCGRIVMAPMRCTSHCCAGTVSCLRVSPEI